MSLTKARPRIHVRGLGNLEVRETDPTVDAEFSSVGHLGETKLSDTHEVVEITDELGDLIDAKSRAQAASIESTLKQSGIDEINLVKNAKGKYYAARYHGVTPAETFQYFCLESAKIKPGIVLDFGTKGERTIAAKLYALRPEQSFDCPAYYLAQTDAEIHQTGLKLWITPRHGYGYLTSKVLDISGFAKHGTLYGYSALTDIWKTGTPDKYLQFDGVNDYLDKGDVCDIDADEDFLIEMWVRATGANGTRIDFGGKKDIAADTNAGWNIYRHTDNSIAVILGDGTDTATIQTAATALLQNVWKHIGLVCDRSGNGVIYINGSATSCVPVDISSIGSLGNAVSLNFGRVKNGAGYDYGAFNLEAARVYNFGAGGLPTDIATIVARHYTAEKTAFGL